MKELLFVYNWIGPEGPLNNFKTPDIHDLANALPYYEYNNGPNPEHDSMARQIKHRIPFKVIPSFAIDSIGDSKFLYEILLTQNLGFHQILLSNHIGVLERSPIPNKVLDKIINGNGYILLTTIYESFLADEFFNQIHSYFSYHSIPMNKIIYLTNCANCKEIYDKFCKLNNIEDKINCEYIGFYLQISKDVLKDENYHRDETKKIKKDRLFLNFNRRHKYHRYLLLLKLMENKLIDDCYISFSQDGGEGVSYQSFIHETYNICLKHGIKLSKNDLNEIYNSLPLVLDSDKFYRFPVEDKIIDTAEWYDKTYIHITSETNFENNIIHLTEKTIKPIIFKQAFIIIGPAKTLAYLKKLGFQTFSNFWDESYDDEIDSTVRMNKIIEILKNIKDWPTEKLNKFLKRSKEIRDHNFNNLKNLPPIEINDFLEKYGVEQWKTKKS